MPSAPFWNLDPAVTFLNHGSFGACPRPVLDRQAELRAHMEYEPVRFFTREAPALLDRSREALAAFVGSRPEDLVLLTNATAGVNTVLRSLDLGPGDAVLLPDQAYNACANAVRVLLESRGVRVDIAALPFPLAHGDDLVEGLLSAVRPDTRLALIDHIISPTGLVLPLERIVPALQERGVQVLVDGAHAPGQVPLDLHALGADYYTGNAHKWLCTPKGAALLHVRADRQAGVRPLVISHGANAPLHGRSRFQVEFAWTGTDDPTALLCIPDALEFLGSLFPSGWEGLQAHNKALVLTARRRLCEVLGQPLPCPEDLVGSLAAVPLPMGPPRPDGGAFDTDPLQDRLLFEHGIEVPVFGWKTPRLRLLRVSGQAYNTPADYERLVSVLPGLLADEAASVGRAR